MNVGKSAVMTMSAVFMKYVEKDIVNTRNVTEEDNVQEPKSARNTKDEKFAYHLLHVVKRKAASSAFHIWIVKVTTKFVSWDIVKHATIRIVVVKVEIALAFMINAMMMKFAGQDYAVTVQGVGFAAKDSV